MFPNDDNFASFVSLESEKTGIVEEKPFRILILGDWSGDVQKKEVSERSLIEIDRDNFDSVINRFQTKLELDLSSDENQILSLEFSELDDFHPDNLFRQVPLFADLRDLRRRLLNPSTFNSAAREVRGWLSENQPIVTPEISSEPKTVNSEDLLDQILSGKSENVKLEATHSAELSGLLKDLVRPYLLGFDENEQKSLVSIVDKATSSLMRKILHHPKFQKLESAWRSLYFLIRNTETNSFLKIYILDISKDELSVKLKQTNNLTDSDVFQKIVVDADKMFDGEYWAAIFGTYDFHPNVDDIAVLIRLSKICKAIQSPFVSNISPELLGIDSLFHKPHHTEWDFSEDSSIGKLWTTLRLMPESEFLGITINKFLTRLPFGSETDEIESFSFEEFEESPIHEKYVWGNTCFICALLLARSFTKYEWNMANNLEQDIEKLPIHIYKEGSETITKPCAEIALTQTACEKLMEFGLMPLISFRNTDRVKLARFQSVTNPVTALAGRWKP